MITSPRTLLISAVSDDEPLTPAQCAYFRSRLKSRMHEAILKIFLKKKEDGFTKADLSRRLGKAPEQITRWLAAPGNLRLDTVSDLLLAMNSELVFDVGPIEMARRSNEFHELASIKPSIATTKKTADIRITRSNIEEMMNAH